MTDDARLSSKARKAILDPRNRIYLSTISVLEVNNKRKSKANNLEFTTAQFVEYCRIAGFIELPLLSEHLVNENELRWKGPGEEHKDPYDRLLLAQARTEGFRLMTHDSKIRLFDESCVLPV